MLDFTKIEKVNKHLYDFISVYSLLVVEYFVEVMIVFYFGQEIQ